MILKFLSNKFPFCAIITAMLLLTGCAYQPKTIKVTEELNLSCIRKKDNVEITTKIVSDTRKGYFYNFVPLQIQIKNGSDNVLCLDSKNTTLKIASFKEVSRKVPSVILSAFTPAAAFAVGGIFFLWEVCLPLAGITMIASTLYGRSHKRREERKLKEIAFFESEKINLQPYQTINKLIFIKEENYNPEFDITLVNQNNNEEINFNFLITAKDNFCYSLE